MAGIIAILEDDVRRIETMRRCLKEKLPAYEVVFVDNAPDMIGWLGQRLSEVKLISLDHDLGPNRQRDGKVFDPGSGRDVADYLAKQPPGCPVIIHTTNSMGAQGMALALDEGGWRHSRVVPFMDLEWIEEAWIVECRAALA